MSKGSWVPAHASRQYKLEATRNGWPPESPRFREKQVFVDSTAMVSDEDLRPDRAALDARGEG